MHTHQVRSALVAALAGVGVMIAGCQSYRSRPLDLEAHRGAWAARSADDESVRAFAQRLGVPGQHTTFDPSDGLSLAEGELILLVYNPELRLARLRAGVAAAGAEHAGRWSDPELLVDVLRITEGVPSPWVIAPALSFTIPISGRLEVEKQLADASSSAELARVAEQEWAQRVELRRQWLRWSASRLRAEETERLLASIDSLVGSTTKLAEAGELPQTEASLFRIERADQAQALLRRRADAAAIEQRLRGLMGLSPDAPLELVPTLALSDQPEEVGHDALARRNLTLARLEQEYEAAERSLNLEIRKQYPDLTIGPQYESDQGQSSIGLIGAIPVPLLNANRRGIAEAEAERELARAAYETEFERLTGALAATRIRLDSLEQQRELYESEIVPLVDGQLADARRLLELGEGGGLVLLESLTRVGSARMSLIETRLDGSLAAAELSGLIGPPPANAAPSLEPTPTNPTPAPTTPNTQTTIEVTP